jgi:hypothetical protein
MQLIGRILLAVIVFTLAFWLVASMAFPLFAFGTPRAFRITVGLACAALVTVPVWRASADPAPGMARSMLKGAGLVGGIGFLGGYVGPMILAPDANQGPLLGIFITGPAGFVIGAIGGALWARRR